MTDLLAPENIDADVSLDNRIRLEVGYLAYLREHGYQIESLDECHAVPSESDESKCYIVQKVTTYEYPKDHPKLDVSQHSHELWACSCWSYRSSTNDVAENEYPPDGDCKHIRSVSRERKAREDDAQHTL